MYGKFFFFFFWALIYIILRDGVSCYRNVTLNQHIPYDKVFIFPMLRDGYNTSVRIGRRG